MKMLAFTPASSSSSLSSSSSSSSCLLRDQAFLLYSERTRFSRSRIFCSIIPARDVMIDFGKFKGSKMGTLPSRYLKWLIREVSETRFDVWAKYAEQVLEDPYYKDRLEWESIEKLSLKKGDVRRSGSSSGPHMTGGAADAGVKGSMRALGWNLSDRDGWNKVNFSLLGTTLGGRIPREEYVDPNKSSTFVSEMGSEMRKTRESSPKLAKLPSNSRPSSNKKLDIANKALVDIRQTMESSPKPTKLPSSNTRAASSKKKLDIASDIVEVKKKPEPETSLRDELLRRRLLRKRIVQPRFSNFSPNNNNNNKDGSGITQFPGRDAFVKKVQDQADR